MKGVGRPGAKAATIAAAALAASVVGGAPADRAGAQGGEREAVPGAEVCDRAGARTGADGRCVLKATTRDVVLTVLTVFGRMHFDHCDIRFELHVDRDGGTKFEQLFFGSNARSRICGGDIATCLISTGYDHPWPGRFVRAGDGSVELDFRLCADSCIGRFEGRTRFRLTGRGKALRLRADDAVAGVSGLKLDGRWILRPAS